MSKSFRFFVILCVVSIVVYCIYPSVIYYFGTSSELQKLSEHTPAKQAEMKLDEITLKKLSGLQKLKERIIKLGLDIKGGIYIVMSIDFKEVADQAEKSVEELSFEEKKAAIEQTMFILQNRIDEFGVSEIVIRRVGAEKIIVQIPGETSSDRIENIIQTSGNLELRLVSEEGMAAMNYDESSGRILNKRALEKKYLLAYLYEKDAFGNRSPTAPVVLNKNVGLSGERIKAASMDYNEYGEIVVSFELDSKGGVAFSKITGENKGRRLAIVLDGKKVYSTPTINAQIFNRGQIDGSFSVEEAKDLSLILRSGYLPGAVKIISKEVIGPKLGRESLQRSLKAMFFGLACVFGFMIFRYRFSGLVASLALLLNGVFVLALLAPFRLSLSLPGIAGLILTLGIAIDANVLIFERVKEEIFKNKQEITLAFERGYKKAFWSIFDANITTILSAFILSNYGEGAIKGFATTLFIGVIVSMFSALFLTRFVFDFLFQFQVTKRFAKIFI